MYTKLRNGKPKIKKHLKVEPKILQISSKAREFEVVSRIELKPVNKQMQGKMPPWNMDTTHVIELYGIS